MKTEIRFPLPWQQMLHRVQLQLHAEIANRLRGFDERAPDVMVPDQRLPVGQPAFIRISDGRRHVKHYGQAPSRKSSRPGRRIE